MPVHLICKNCGKPYTTKPARAPKSIACSKQCLGVLQRELFKGWRTNPNPKRGPDSPLWRGGSRKYWKRFYKDACERCGETTKHRLCIHHIDENRKNNDLSNLETLCRKCHQDHHAEPRRDPATGRYAKVA